MLDDTVLNLHVLKAWITKQNQANSSIHMFTIPEDFLDFLDKEAIENSLYIFFLDIEASMNLDGFKIARMIRQKFSESGCKSLYM